MRFGVVVFPGSNCDHDAWYATSRNLGHLAENDAENDAAHEAVYLWHHDTDLKGSDCVILPGGFSYGDYLRCGAIAKFSPIMAAVKRFAADGGLVFGICNGFQILTECGLLPGVLVRNRGLRFICKDVRLRAATRNSPFTNEIPADAELRMPIAHGEGCYTADERTLDELEADDRIAFRYVENPNGSMRDIAGVLSAGRNVLGMMPHPERATEPLVGSTDGLAIFRSLVSACSTAK